MKKTILNDIRMMAVLLVACGAMVACSSEDDALAPASEAGKVYTMTVEATKGGSEAATRALAESGTKISTTWSVGDKVEVWSTADTPAKLGELTAQSAGANTLLSGTLTTAPSVGDEVKLKYLSPDYSSQDGTLTGSDNSIDKKCDYAEATATIATVDDSGNIGVSGTVNFTNQQAIVKFTLVDNAATPAAINAMKLIVNDGTTDYTVIPASPTSEIYVAIPGISGKTVTLTSTVGDDTYTYEKTGVTFTNGQYYEITVKMEKEVILNITNPAKGQVIGSDGNNYNAGTLPTGVTAVAMIAYVDGSHGLALALQDESGVMNWSAAQTAAAAHRPAFSSGGTWRHATAEEWLKIAPSYQSCTDLDTALSTAGGSPLQRETNYWGGADGSSVKYLKINNNGKFTYPQLTADQCLVRACLVF